MKIFFLFIGNNYYLIYLKQHTLLCSISFYVILFFQREYIVSVLVLSTIGVNYEHYMCWALTRR